MFVTSRFLVKFTTEVDEERRHGINERYGVREVERLDYAENAFTLESETPGRSAIELANIYREREPTEWAHPVFIRRQVRKAGAAPAPAASERIVPADKRWHLGSTQSRVIDAWATPGLPAGAAKGARSIRIAVLDDGMDIDHPDFAGRVVAQFDFAAGTADARPKETSDKHGTACFGVAGGADSGPASGAAPNCSLIAVRTPSFLGVDEEAQMFKWAADQKADVISCSWGPADNTGDVDPIPDNVAAAVEYCVTQGRGGKGIPIFFAAGNGDELVSTDGYASNPNIIAVAASTSRNVKSWYSDFGPEIWICAPSSGDDNAGELSIFTTDRQGAQGYNLGSAALGDSTGNYTGDFGGTSSAAPLAAGICGLVLSANPNLTENPRTRREVREVLAATAAKIGTGYTNGRSPEFGFGRIDAAAAVQEALRRVGQQPGGGTRAKPTIDGPDRWPRGATPPTFRVDSGAANRFYAVEVAAEARLLVAANRGSNPMPDRFYGSWRVLPFRSGPYPADFTLPQQEWDLLKGSARLFYRVWASDDANSWVNAAASTSDGDIGSARSFEITEEPGGTVRPAITVDASADRNGPPPTFMVNPGPGRSFAVEVARDRTLLDASNSGRRSPDKFFASWQGGPLHKSLSYPAPYRLPVNAWAQLKSAPELYYRAWGSDTDGAWSNENPSLEDADFLRAPSIAITGTSTQPGGTQPGGGTPVTSVRYPSGAAFEAVDPQAADDRVNYNVAASQGMAPLVRLRERFGERLSANFLAREFATRPAGGSAGDAGLLAYARISPELVSGLQRLRERLDKAIVIVSAFRPPPSGADVLPEDQFLYLTGQAAEIRSPGVTPLALARLALEEIGTEIGLGMKRDSIHIDLRGTLAGWVEEGAGMDLAGFDQWLNGVVGDIRETRRVRWFPHAETNRWGTPVSAGAGVSVVGPDMYLQNSLDPPAFYVEFDRDVACRIEVATSKDTLGREDAAASERVLSEPLRPEAGFSRLVWRLPAEAWEKMRGYERLYYRAVADAAPDAAAGAAADEVASIGLSGRTLRQLGRLARQLPPRHLAVAVDESRWRGTGASLQGVALPG